MNFVESFEKVATTPAPMNPAQQAKPPNPVAPATPPLPKPAPPPQNIKNNQGLGAGAPKTPGQYSNVSAGGG